MNKLTKYILSILAPILFQYNVISQTTTVNSLIAPDNWKYEKIDFPLDFAPDILYSGFEELLFSPGMFDTASVTYFTYLFAVSIENKAALTKAELKSFLIKYYQGLSKAVGKSKGITVNEEDIKVAIKEYNNSNSQNKHYNATVLFIDTFTSGQKVLLNMDLEITSNQEAKHTYILALVSPQPENSSVWKELQEIKKLQAQ